MLKNIENDNYTVYRDDGTEINVKVENKKPDFFDRAKLHPDEREWFKINSEAL